MFAGAQPDGFRRLQLEADRREIGTGMGAVAIGLVARPAATAPPVFPGFQIRLDGLLAGDDGFAHFFLPLVKYLTEFVG